MEQEEKQQFKSFVVPTLSMMTGLHVKECRKAVEANPDYHMKELLQYMLDNYKLNDGNIKRIEEFINHCEEE